MNNLKSRKRSFIFLCVLFVCCLSATNGYYPKQAMAQEEAADEGGGDAIVETIKSSVSWPEGSAIRLDKRTGTLIVTNTPDNQKIVEKVVRQIDKPPTQVSIETRFIDIRAAALQSLGVEFTSIGSHAAGENQSKGFTDSSSFAMDVDFVAAEASTDIISALRGFSAEGLTATFTRLNHLQLTAVLDAIKKTGESNTLSAPRVTVINRQEAVIKVISEYRFAQGPEEYYDIVGTSQLIYIVPTTFDETTETGIILTVTPDVGDNNNVTLDINPQVSEISDWLTYGTGTESLAYAVIDARNITTNVIVNSGETVVMGGLVRSKESENIRKIPFLGDIPLFGFLFKRKTVTEEQRSLLIFVTVDLLTPAGEKLVD